MNIKLLSAAIIVASLLAAPNQSAHATEIPDYTVVETDGPFEIREYPSMLIAEVTVEGNRRRAGSLAFRKLGGFIFGDNQARTEVAMTAPVTQTPQASQKIAMTAPVVQTPSEGEKWTVNFMMPSKYTLENLPAPNDPDITIRETEPYRAITIRFPGTASSESLTWHREQLDAYAQAAGLKTAPTPDYAFYDAPYVPGPFRRNEIHYRLTE